jgi:hypothetical protein
MTMSTIFDVLAIHRLLPSDEQVGSNQGQKAICAKSRLSQPTSLCSREIVN